MKQILILLIIGLTSFSAVELISLQKEAKILESKGEPTVSAAPEGSQTDAHEPETNTGDQENLQDDTTQGEVLEVVYDISSESQMYGMYYEYLRAIGLFDPIGGYLSDFTGDGQDELVVRLLDEDGNKFEVWGYDEEKNEIYSINSFESNDYWKGGGDFQPMLQRTSWGTGMIALSSGESYYGESILALFYVNQQGEWVVDEYLVTYPSRDTPLTQCTFTFNGEEFTYEAYMERIEERKNSTQENLALTSDITDTMKFLENYSTAIPLGITTDTAICGFEDVSPEDWFAPYVAYVVKNRFMTLGYSSSHFYPNMKVNRGMVSEAYRRLYLNFREYGTPLPTYKEYRPEAKNTIYAYDDFLCMTLELPSFYFTKEGSVYDTIRKEEFLLILYDFFGKDQAFSKVLPADLENISHCVDKDEISSGFETAVSWAVANELLFVGDGKISPQSELTRAEFAVILQKAKEYFLERYYIT